MGKRGKERKRKRAGLAAEPGAAADINEDDPLGGLSEGDVVTTIRTLETLGRDAALFKSRPFKKLRAALAPCALALVGQDATDDRQRRKLERPVQDEDERRRVMDRDAKNRTALRKERLDRLETAGLVADGPALAPQLLLTDGSKEDSLNRAVACYCCKAPFSELHHFYAALCPACASLNFEKRTQTADLRGRGALVTGARVKIGFRVALKLLRAGATVVATSRFPADAAARYAAEADAEEWRDRLRVVGCDFRDLGAVEALCAAVPELLGCGLDVLVNNACQTVRRPPQYYAQTVAREAKLRKAIGNASLPLLEGPAIADANEPTADVSLMRSWTAKAPTTSDPALRALLCVAPGDDVRDDAAFPAGKTDGNADLSEQLDLRRDNSWTQKIDEISTPELAEVFAINALAPFVINSKLIPVLKDGASNERRRFVINVSAMEGKFYRHKQPTHPHTC
jgi:NAD(P)-dependent dehydrogenase (short-subunit alcohol dehydrogenase family)